MSAIRRRVSRLPQNVIDFRSTILEPIHFPSETIPYSIVCQKKCRNATPFFEHSKKQKQVPVNQWVIEKPQRRRSTFLKPNAIGCRGGGGGGLAVFLEKHRLAAAVGCVDARGYGVWKRICAVCTVLRRFPCDRTLRCPLIRMPLAGAAGDPPEHRADARRTARNSTLDDRPTPADAPWWSALRASGRYFADRFF